jgi:hypothetical protein
MKNSTMVILALTLSLSAVAQSPSANPTPEKRGSFISRLFKKKTRPTPVTKAPAPVPAPVKVVIEPGPENSLAVTMMPKFYKKRKEAILDIGLVYYGDYYNMDDLSRVQELLEERFFKATGQALKINTVAKAVIPFNTKIEDHPEYRQDHVTEIERLQRLWYYDNVGMGVAKEVHGILQKDTREIDLENIDVLVIVTGAQFDALGFASGRVAVTENPMEIAWGLEDGGRVEFVTDARVVDELIHEVGHAMFLDHTSNQCQKPGMSYTQQEACCATSPAKDDVMSYCRRRAKVDETFFYGFEECNQKIIKEKIVPAMLSGGAWAIENREACL